MELDLTQVRAFVVTAEQLHFGRAAARLFLTQQALSKRIQRLEHSLGEPLFVRGPRGVELTEAGHRFLPHARALLRRPRQIVRREAKFFAQFSVKTFESGSQFGFDSFARLRFLQLWKT